MTLFPLFDARHKGSYHVPCRSPLCRNREDVQRGDRFRRIKLDCEAGTFYIHFRVL